MRPWCRGLIIFFMCSGAVAQAADVDEIRPPRKYDPDAVWFLVPGFAATRLPIALTNINSVEYGPDGRLYAAGYDGRIHVLSDGDGDGLEETVRPYWYKEDDVRVPVGMVVNRDGVYLASRGKVVLIRDSDGDGRGDTSEIVASHWPEENHKGSKRADALGIALDAEGNLYFSLGCADFRNAYLLDSQKKPHYSLRSERGTILKVSPDRKQRTIVATGIRFAVALAFNRHGDLFATDQEGATWFEGGNPLDELLHIIPGRHYGFPYRHPEYLPNVVDEPSVVDFGPQHQSTCGFRFNETHAGRRRFGPSSWEDDALVTGFSRGKLWRVPLVKTRAGYVGKEILVASFETLLTDVITTPQGDLIVAAHGGRPDWGSGPKQEGFLYKLRFVDGKAPQPAAAWATGPFSVKVAFDRPLHKRLGRKVGIETGAFVRAGDRLEVMKPNYKVVEEAMGSPRHALQVRAVGLSRDRRTVTLSTGAHPWQASYAVTLPGVSGARRPGPPSTVDVLYDLTGVEASWTPAKKRRPAWQGWLPHIDLAVARDWTQGSAEHEELDRLMRRPGQLVVKTRLRLGVGKTVLRLEANGGMAVKAEGFASIASTAVGGGRHHSELTIEAAEGPVPVEIRLTTGEAGTGEVAALDASFHTDVDPHERPLPIQSLILRWAPLSRPPRASSDRPIVALAGGNPAEGRRIFFEEAKCGVCHLFGREGGNIGPDLTNSPHRYPAAILEDIVNPNATINPDYLSVVVEMKNGATLAGMIRQEDQRRIELVDSQARSVQIDRRRIKAIQVGSLSLMPEGFSALGEEKLKHLLSFLVNGGTTTSAR